jgi:hypothetical protein
LPKLRLVTSGRDDGLGDWEQGFNAPPPAARPSDRCEPWLVEVTQELRALAQAAAALGISPTLAAVLVVERWLVASDLEGQDLESLVPELDAEAAKARVTIELSEPLSAYLVALAGGVDRAAVLPPVLALPMRLTERIVARGRVPELDPALLKSALLWERAAVLSGRTMGEWAALTVLALPR